MAEGNFPGGNWEEDTISRELEEFERSALEAALGALSILDILISEIYFLVSLHGNHSAFFKNPKKFFSEPV